MNNATIDELRLEANSKLDPKKKWELGQFMTPSNIAELMSNFFDSPKQLVKLLDCGAGIGSLTIPAVKKLKRISSLEVWEIDSILNKYLGNNLEKLNVPYVIHCSDFVEDSVINILENKGTRFTHAILNPPYKKIKSSSFHRLLLSKIGVETVNIYTGFLAITILLMEKNGQIVAIIPRSFCNGPYYKPFREFMFKNCSIERIHIFESRKKAFKDDDVLQENIIIKLIKNKEQNDVIISSSHDQNLTDYKEKIFSFNKIVKQNDTEFFIHIPKEEQEFNKAGFFVHSLKDLELEVSTGPVVDFRMKDYWLQEPQKDSVPLIYPHHFSDGILQYPKKHKKPNALMRNDIVDKWLMPNGFYVIVKRFSSKEEKRRVVAYVFNPSEINADKIGFENHWNVFHFKKRGIDRDIANGLACFLNSTELDNHFRIFSGHTQVNATDLKNMKYPDKSFLIKIGKKFDPLMTQDQIDSILVEKSHDRTTSKRSLLSTC